MTKYFIASKDISSGVSGDDNIHLQVYTELGWELAVSRIYLNDLLQKNIIDKENDFIVTSYDRHFLYSKYFKNVISYSNFIDTVKETDFVDDLTIKFYEIIDEIGKDRTISLYKENIYLNNINTDVDLHNINNVLKNDNNFICLVIRKRDSYSKRNMSDESINEIINFYTSNNVSVYLMGKNCQSYDNGKNVFHVDYKSFATLINSEKCLKMITPLSGGGMIRFFTGICPLYVFLEETEPRQPLSSFHYGDGIDAFKNTFKNGDMYFVNSIEEILNDNFEKKENSNVDRI